MAVAGRGGQTGHPLQLTASKGKRSSYPQFSGMSCAIFLSFASAGPGCRLRRTSLALSYVQALDISIDFQHDDALILSLARTHALTVYDAAYLELALRKRLPLLTLDTKLNTAFLAAASG